MGSCTLRSISITGYIFFLESEDQIGLVSFPNHSPERVTQLDEDENIFPWLKCILRSHKMYLLQDTHGIILTTK